MMCTVALAVGTSMHTVGTPLTVSVPFSSVIVSVPPFTVSTLPAAIRSAELSDSPATTWYVKTLVSRSLSASTAWRSAGGSAAKASLVGAKMVNGPSLLSVSTSPAWVTAVTSVESTGLLLAAVAAGSSAMPPKLPSPSAGTAEQAGPLGAPAICPASSDIADSAGAGAAVAAD